MAEMSAAAVVLIPLLLLMGTALYLLRLGMTARELSDAARQRLAGSGMILLYLVTLFAIGVIGLGMACLTHAFRL
jgi:hypothetical protein